MILTGFRQEKKNDPPLHLETKPKKSQPYHHLLKPLRLCLIFARLNQSFCMNCVPLTLLGVSLVINRFLHGLSRVHSLNVFYSFLETFANDENVVLDYSNCFQVHTLPSLTDLDDIVFIYV